MAGSGKMKILYFQYSERLSQMLIQNEAEIETAGGCIKTGSNIPAEELNITEKTVYKA